MIKKSVFEDDLIRGMQSELVKQAHNVEVQDLSIAADYLNSAAQILDEIGMVEASDKVLNVLLKIADTSQKVVHKGFPSMQIFLEAGLTPDQLNNISNNIFIAARVVDILKNMHYSTKEMVKLLGERVIKISEQVNGMKAGDPIATAKINAYLRDFGKNDAEIIAEIGFKNFMSEREVRKVLSTPALDIIPSNVYQGRTSNPEMIEKIEPYELEEVVATQKPRNPTKISDRHTKGLTSEKMVNNLKHHGTVFNLADDGLADDELTTSENDFLPQLDDFEDEIE